MFEKGDTMINAVSVPLAVPQGSLDAYIETVSRIPVLDRDEEARLARQFREDGDLEAARQLVMAHLRFVVRVARGYNGYGLAQGDLIQEGNIGLMKAVKRFDPDVGVRLVSFAVHWIRAEMHEYIIRNWRIVKVATTKAQRKLFFNLRSAKKRLGWMNRNEAESIAQDLGVSTAEVLRMEERLSAHDSSFDGPVHITDDTAPVPANILEDRSFEPEVQLLAAEADALISEHLTNALSSLDDRSRDIVASRWLTEPKQTLQQLADKYEISAERIRQLEKNALGKLKQAVADTPLLAASI